MTTWRKIITLYQTNRRGIVYYILLKAVFFGLLILALRWLKSELLTDNEFVYDLNILKYFSPDDVFAFLVVGMFWLLFFVLERNFLIFYFVNKYKQGNITPKIFWRDFLLTQFTQLKIFLLEAIIDLLNIALFSVVIYTTYYFLGINVVFYFIVGLLTVILIYILIDKLLRFIFVMYSFFDNPREKNIFVYFAREFAFKKKKQFFLIIFKTSLIFLFIFGGSLILAELGRYLIGWLDNFQGQVYLLVALLFGQALFFFAVNIMIYVFLFFKLAEAYFEEKATYLKSVEEEGEGQFFKKIKYRILIRGIAVMVLVVFLIGLYLYFVQITFVILVGENKPKLIFAHRGFSEYEVQNSLPAFRRAVGEADFIELDVQITKDGRLVIFHDENFKKLTGEVGVVGQRDFAEIKTYTVTENKKIKDNEADTEIKQARIILLEDVLRELGGKVKFAVEIKNTDKNRSEELVVKLNNLIQQYKLADKVLIISLDYDVLQLFEKINPEIKRGLILTYPLSDLKQFDVDFYFINSLINSEGLIKEAHKLGRPVYFWNFSFWRNDFEKEYVLGADGFVTDNPTKTKKQIEWYREMPLSKKVNVIFKNLLR